MIFRALPKHHVTLATASQYSIVLLTALIGVPAFCGAAQQSVGNSSQPRSPARGSESRASIPPGGPPLVFTGVTVVDVQDGQRRVDQTVVVVGARVQAVGATSAVPIPVNATVVDARGKYLIPGLWDMQVHPME